MVSEGGCVSTAGGGGHYSEPVEKHIQLVGSLQVVSTGCCFTMKSVI